MSQLLKGLKIDNSVNQLIKNTENTKNSMRPFQASEGQNALEHPQIKLALVFEKGKFKIF